MNVLAFSAIGAMLEAVMSEQDAYHKDMGCIWYLLQLKNQDEQMVFMWDCACAQRHCSAVTQQVIPEEVFELRAEEQVRFL